MNERMNEWIHCFMEMINRLTIERWHGHHSIIILKPASNATMLYRECNSMEMIECRAQNVI